MRILTRTRKETTQALKHHSHITWGIGAALLPSPVKFLPRRKKKGKLTWIRRVAGCRLGLKPAPEDPDES
jgi:hypothetical protein